MKFIEKMCLVIFSLIISVISISLILIVLNIVDITLITKTISYISQDENTIKITIGVTAFILLLALKCLFFRAPKEDDGRNGVTLENSAGKLIISRESLENLIANVVKDVYGIEAISSRTILDKNNNLIVYVTTLVSKDIMIKDVSAQIQEKIKETLSRTADLEVKQVNIKIKNITNKKIKGLPAGEEPKEAEPETVNESEDEE